MGLSFSQRHVNDINESTLEVLTWGVPLGEADSTSLVTEADKPHRDNLARVKCICIVCSQRTRDRIRPSPLTLWPAPPPGGSPQARPIHLTCCFRMQLEP